MCQAPRVVLYCLGTSKGQWVWGSFPCWLMNQFACNIVLEHLLYFNYIIQYLFAFSWMGAYLCLPICSIHTGRSHDPFSGPLEKPQVQLSLLFSSQSNAKHRDATQNVIAACCFSCSCETTKISLQSVRSNSISRMIMCQRGLGFTINTDFWCCPLLTLSALWVIIWVILHSMNDRWFPMHIWWK